MAEQVIYEDGQWDALKLPNSSVQVFDGLPGGTQSNSSLPHVMLPNGPLSSGTSSKKRTRATCDEAEGSPSEDATMSEADPADEQPAAVRVCRHSASVQPGAPVRSFEGTPAYPPAVYYLSHKSVQEGMSPAESTTAYGKEPSSPTALAKHADSAPGNHEPHQRGRSHIMIEDRPAESSLIRISAYFD
jgi:hypothetical protein